MFENPQQNLNRGKSFGFFIILTRLSVHRFAYNRMQMKKKTDIIFRFHFVSKVTKHFSISSHVAITLLNTNNYKKYDWAWKDTHNPYNFPNGNIQQHIDIYSIPYKSSQQQQHSQHANPRARHYDRSQALSLNSLPHGLCSDPPPAISTQTQSSGHCDVRIIWLQSADEQGTKLQLFSSTPIESSRVCDKPSLKQWAPPSSSLTAPAWPPPVSIASGLDCTLIILLPRHLSVGCVGCWWT